MKSFAFVLVLFFLLAGAGKSVAQEVKTVCGEYTYYVPEHVSRTEAKRVALENARLQALADAFGTTVSQANTSIRKEEGGAVDDRFFSLAATEVRGEWIADEREPEYTFRLDDNDGTLIVTCRVCGKARKIANAQADFVAKVLRNGTDERFESNEFRSGDDMYLYFRSPVDGYVAVYLVDETPAAYCLLPYRRDSDGRQSVKHGQEYVFFSSDRCTPDEANILDEYTLTCSNEVEYNRLYIIFSSKPFTKPLDEQQRELMPHELTYQDFIRWLGDSRKTDSEMAVEVKDIRISK